MDIVVNGRFLTQQITGVQRYSREMMHGFDAILNAKKATTITILCPRLHEPPPVWDNLRIREVGRLQGHAWEQFELPLYSRGKLLFCPGNLVPIGSLLSSQRIAVTIHDLSFQYYPSAYSAAFRAWYNLIVPMALRYADPVITVSHSERAAIVSRYPFAASKLHVIPNGSLPFGVDPSAGRDEVATEKKDFILYAGSFSRHKNFHGFIQAACRLAQKRGFRFLVAGGANKSFSRLGITLPRDVEHLITFAGRVDDDTLFSYYRRAACLVFPSFCEASGLPTTEAMAFGCPVIASKIPALKERCGDAAIFCDPHDVESITSAIERVMDDDALRAELGRKGPLRAAHFSWRDSARSAFRILQQANAC